MRSIKKMNKHIFRYFPFGQYFPLVKSLNEKDWLLIKALIGHDGLTMEKYLQENIELNGRFTFLSENFSNPNIPIDPKIARKILKEFGLKKKRLNGYTEIQTVKEWMEYKLQKKFNDTRIIEALKDSKNEHIWNFLDKCIIYGNKLYEINNINNTMMYVIQFCSLLLLIDIFESLTDQKTIHSFFKY